MSFSTPQHLLSKRKNGCGWNSKGKMTNSIESYTPCSIEMQSEVCPDVFWDGCMEKLLGTGNQKRDLLGTVESSRLIRELLLNVYRGLGNSLYELAWFGNHPLIQTADAAGTYTMSEELWLDYVDQQESCTGFITLIDQLKQDGRENYNITIEDDEVEGADYKGEVGGTDGLFNRMLKKNTPAMRTAAKYGNAVGGIGMGIFVVSPSIFNKFEEEIYEKFPTLPATMQYYYTGEFCKNVGCNSMQPVRGVLNYKGHWVVCEDAWETYDEIVNVHTHRALYLTPGVLGLASDISLESQFTGLGLRMTQKLEPPYMGKIYMDTLLRLGFYILDVDHVINASKVLQIEE
jgi:hypothetical protein